MCNPISNKYFITSCHFTTITLCAVNISFFLVFDTQRYKRRKNNIIEHQQKKILLITEICIINYTTHKICTKDYYYYIYTHTHTRTYTGLGNKDAAKC